MMYNSYPDLLIVRVCNINNNNNSIFIYLRDDLTAQSKQKLSK
jgi:hypothetical protein